MLWITLIWLWNGANLSIYEHVTHFVPNIRHKAYNVLKNRAITLCESQHEEKTKQNKTKQNIFWISYVDDLFIKRALDNIL